MLWMRINALAAAALLSLLSTEAVQAQMQNPSMNAQAMMMHHQMMNQMDMMRRSQQLQSMARAREAQGHCRGAAQGATGKTAGQPLASLSSARDGAGRPSSGGGRRARPRCGGAFQGRRRAPHLNLRRGSPPPTARQLRARRGADCGRCPRCARNAQPEWPLPAPQAPRARPGVLAGTAGPSR